MTKQKLAIIVLFFTIISFKAFAQNKFHVVAFYTGKEDLAHISFMHEAHKWFTLAGEKYGFSYDSTNTGII